MKFIKLFMLLAVVSVFAACSSDDDYNTNETTVSFASDAITTKESAGIINIPIKVTSLRNGSVNVTVKAEEVGDNPAKEDVNYLITSKNINLNADDAETATMNVEIKIVDDDEINENRTFKLTIINANGAQIGDKASTTITIATTMQPSKRSSSASGLFREPWKIQTEQLLSARMLRFPAKLMRMHPIMTTY